MGYINIFRIIILIMAMILMAIQSGPFRRIIKIVIFAHIRYILGTKTIMSPTLHTSTKYVKYSIHFTCNNKIYADI